MSPGRACGRDCGATEPALGLASWQSLLDDTEGVRGRTSGRSGAAYSADTGDASMAPLRGDRSMTAQDDRRPRPTDPPIDPTEFETPPDSDDDTEGHSLLNAEFGRTVARDHVREADRIARDSARVRDAHK